MQRRGIAMFRRPGSQHDPALGQPRAGLCHIPIAVRLGCDAPRALGLLEGGEVALAQGRTVGEICRELGVSEASFYRWRAEYGGLKVDQAEQRAGLSARQPRKRCCPGHQAPPTLRSGRARPPGQNMGLVSHSPRIPYRGRVTSGQPLRHQHSTMRRRSGILMAVHPGRRVEG